MYTNDIYLASRDCELQMTEENLNSDMDTIGGDGRNRELNQVHQRQCQDVFSYTMLRANLNLTTF